MTEEEDRQAYLKELNDTLEFEGKKILGAYAIGRTLIINYPPKWGLMDRTAGITLITKGRQVTNEQ